MENLTPAVFFDRDGTLIEEAHYLKDVKDLKLYKDTAAAVKKLNEKGILAIMVSNQSGVARGYFDENTVQFLNKNLNEKLMLEGAHLDGFYYCPHHKNGKVEEYSKECNCRKPSTGMIEAALKDFCNIDVEKSYVVGDKPCDIDLAKNAGLKGVLVKTGHGKNVSADECDADFLANDIKQAVSWILADMAI